MTTKIHILRAKREGKKKLICGVCGKKIKKEQEISYEVIENKKIPMHHLCFKQEFFKDLQKVFEKHHGLFGVN